jgi:uncharacterized protein (DUF934 family)
MTEAITRVWNGSAFIDNDPWQPWSGSGAVGPHDIVPLADFLALVDNAQETVRAVSLRPADDTASLAGKLDHLTLITIAFPAFSDGRGYSQAALLRDRHGYPGDLRATGHILVDQISHMMRTGFSSLAVTDPVAQRRLETGGIPAFPGFYQPAVRAEPTNASYSWRRLAG